MNPKYGKFVESWGKTRKLGKWKYAIIHGSISWALIAGVFSFFLLILLDDTLTFSEFNSKRFLVHMISFTIGGFFYGLFEWRRNNKIYDKYKSFLSNNQ